MVNQAPHQPGLNKEVLTMKLLEEYAECLKLGDAGRMAMLFAEDATFYDDGFIKSGLEPVSLKGRANIEVFLQGLFAQGGLNVTNVAINGNAMRYDITHEDMVFMALGVMREENNLIQDYRVTIVF